jgi:hypothetical protein
VDRRDGVGVERVQVLVGELVARLLEPPARVAVGRVRDRRRQHPVADGAAVVGRLERRLEVGDPLGVLAGQLAEVALAPEAEELEVVAPAHGAPDALHGRGIDERRVPLVDRAQVEIRLQAGVMAVVLVVELRDEPVGAGAVAVELAVGRRLLLGRACAHAA